MYAKMQLPENIVLAEAPPPEGVAGLDADSLANLSAALRPCPPEYKGLGFWPLETTPQDIEWWQEFDYDNPTYSVDSAGRKVSRTFPVKPGALSIRKEGMARAEVRRYEERVAEGFSYSGHVYQIDEKARGRMNTVAVAFITGVANAHAGFWRDVENVNVPMTDDECQAFFRAALEYETGLRREAWDRGAKIAAAKSHVDLDALAAGWV